MACFPSTVLMMIGHRFVDYVVAARVVVLAGSGKTDTIERYDRGAVAAGVR